MGPHKLLTIKKRVGPFVLLVDCHGDVYLIVLRIVILRQTLLQTHLLQVYLWILDQIFLQAFMRWRSAPSSTLYPPTTSESFPDSSSKMSLDSSSPSIRQSRKRCRSTATLVPSSTPVSRSIAPALADLSPRERFRDSYSSEVGREEHMEIGTVDAETVVDLGISDGVGAHIEDGIDIVGIQSFYT
ncbi:hypothetical protein Tco_0455704 [Tanacetum coccineum]